MFDTDLLDHFSVVVADGHLGLPLVDVYAEVHLFSLRGTGALDEIHVFGLSRLALAAPVGLGRPTLGFLRTWTSQFRAVEAAESLSVSSAPYVAFTWLR